MRRTKWAVNPVAQHIVFFFFFLILLCFARVGNYNARHIVRKYTHGQKMNMFELY